MSGAVLCRGLSFGWLVDQYSFPPKIIEPSQKHVSKFIEGVLRYFETCVTFCLSIQMRTRYSDTVQMELLVAVVPENNNTGAISLYAFFEDQGSSEKKLQEI